MSRNIARTFISGWSEPPAGGFPAASRLSGLKAWSRHVPLTSISCVRSATALTPHDPNIAPGLTLRLLTVTACGTGGKPLSVGASRAGGGQGRQRAGAARSRGEGGKGWGGAPHRDQVALLEHSEGVGRDGGLLVTGRLDRLQLLLHRVHDRRHSALDHLGAVLFGHLEPLVLHGFGQAHLGSRTSGRGQLVLRNATRRWHQREHRRLGAAPAGHRLALGGEAHHVLRQVCTRDEVVSGQALAHADEASVLETTRLGERHGVFDDAGGCQLCAHRVLHYAARRGVCCCGRRCLGLCARWRSLRLSWRRGARRGLLSAAHLLQ
eukprot:scaffold53517_cov54-Phaeocystis_antarctica.AAC.1